MKKITTLLFILCTITLLTGCGKGEELITHETSVDLYVLDEQFVDIVEYK